LFIKSAKTEKWCSGSFKYGIYLNKKRFLKPLPSSKYVNPLHSYNLKMPLVGEEKKQEKRKSSSDAPNLS